MEVDLKTVIESNAREFFYSSKIGKSWKEDKY